MKKTFYVLLLVVLTLSICSMAEASMLILQPDDGKDAHITATMSEGNVGTHGDLMANLYFLSSDNQVDRPYNPRPPISARRYPIPEPSTFLLLGFSLLGTGFLRRKKS